MYSMSNLCCVHVHVPSVKSKAMADKQRNENTNIQQTLNQSTQEVDYVDTDEALGYTFIAHFPTENVTLKSRFRCSTYSVHVWFDKISCSACCWKRNCNCDFILDRMKSQAPVQHPTTQLPSTTLWRPARALTTMSSAT